MADQSTMRVAIVSPVASATLSAANSSRVVVVVGGRHLRARQRRADGDDAQPAARAPARARRRAASSRTSRARICADGQRSAQYGQPLVLHVVVLADQVVGIGGAQQGRASRPASSQRARGRAEATREIVAQRRGVERGGASDGVIPRNRSLPPRPSASSRSARSDGARRARRSARRGTTSSASAADIDVSMPELCGPVSARVQRAVVRHLEHRAQEVRERRA